MNRPNKQVKSRKYKRTNLFSDKAYYLLRKMISDLKLSPKEPLSELKLAARLGVSRTPVREALKRLKTEGLLTSYGNKGYVLNIPTIKEIRDIYGVRMVLEGGAAKSAAENIDLDRLEYFERQFISVKNGLNRKSEKENITHKELNHFKQLDGEHDLVRLGKEFHLFIIEASNNEKLKELVKNINSQLEISRIFSYQRRRKEAVEEHLRIVRALKERNGEKSRAYMEEHLRNAFETLTKIM